MRPTTGRPKPIAESGFALIEVLVSALLIVIVGSAVLGLMTASTRSANQQRVRTQEYAAAQEDQARMRSMRISSLTHLKEVRPVTLNGTALEVESSAAFVNNSSGTASCAENESSPDYVRITSTVRQESGKGSPITLQSIISPSNGSLDPAHGSLVIAATNAQGQGLAGLVLTGTGTGNFSGETDENGCAIFADLPAGSYTLTPSGVGLVDKFGKPPASQSVQVSGNQTQRLPLLYDRPGTLRVPIVYKLGSTTYGVVPKYIAAYNAEVGSTAARFEPTLEEVGSTKYSVIASMFPAKTAYTVYPGPCEGDRPPTTTTEAYASATVLAAGTVTSSQVRMPTLEVTVTNGSTRLQGAKVTLSDDNCSAGDYEYTTESNGHQSATTTGPLTPAVPWSTYDICASAYFYNTYHRLRANNVSIETLTSTVTKSLNLSGPGSESGYSRQC